MRVFLENRWKAHKARLAHYIDEDEEGGTTTIEFVLWLPIFILILSLVIDVCFVFLGQAVMYDVASDSARRASVGQEVGTGNCADGSATLLVADTCDRATYLGATPTVTIACDGNEAAYVVTITHFLGEIDVVGVLGFISDETISSVVTQLAEGGADC